MKKIIEGVKAGMSDIMVEQAKQFMAENGYKMTIYGKNQAITDLETNDGYGYDAEFVTALKTAIATLKVEKPKKGVYN